MAFLHPSIPSPELSGVPRAGAPLPPRLIVHERPWPSEWQSRLSRPSWQLGHLRRGKIVSIACVLANTVRCAPHTVASPERRAFLSTPTARVPRVVRSLSGVQKGGNRRIHRREVLPSLPTQQQVDSVWRDSNTRVVAISPAVYMAFEVLSKAVQKHTEQNFSDDLGWSGSTVNTLRHWLLFLNDEAVTDARVGSEIRLIGPWEEGAQWPEGLPHGGKDAPYTELMRVVAGGHAPCFEALSRWSTSLLSPFLLSDAWRPDWPYCHWTQAQVRGQAQRMVKERRQTQGSMCGPPCVCTRAEIRHAHVWQPRVLQEVHCGVCRWGSQRVP